MGGRAAPHAEPTDTDTNDNDSHAQQQEEEQQQHAPVWAALRKVQAASRAILSVGHEEEGSGAKVGVSGDGGTPAVPPMATTTPAAATPRLSGAGMEEGGEGAVREAAAVAVEGEGAGGGGGNGGQKGPERRRTAAHTALSSLLDGDVSGSGRGVLDGSGAVGGGGVGGSGGLWGDSSSSSATGTLDPKLSELLS